METLNLQPEKPTSVHARVSHAFMSFSATDKVICVLLILVFISSALYLVKGLSNYFSVEVPIPGGTITEGIIGYPRYINPLLSVTDTGRDISELIYSGLMRATADGKLIPDLAESYTISEDQLTYTFTLKKDITFHDDVPVTADDILFTIEKAKDVSVQSVKRANWAGVTVQKIDDHTIQFNLQKPYAPFIENTTLGILPKHIWKNIPADQFSYSQFNEKPIGSGPYALDKIQYDAAGMPQSYDLEAFSNYALGQPYISNIHISIYQNENTLVTAFDSGEIDSMYDISPEQATKIDQAGSHIELATLPRVFGVFFNQNQSPVLANKEVRQALELAVDKQDIIKTVLAGYAIPISTPIPPGLLPVATTTATTSTPTIPNTGSLEAAKKLLIDKGWTISSSTNIFEKKSKTAPTQTLSFSIATPDAPELVQIAKMIQTRWQSMGADVTVKIFEANELNQTVIRPRKYDALLFGEIIGRDLDLYAFWHSSQRTDPGLNITGYVNLKVDKILETARTSTDTLEQVTQYQDFQTEISNDIPAIFLYSPQFTYVIPDIVQGVHLTSITVPAERFSDVYHWYIETDSVWKIFDTKKQ